jgi:3-phosphoshikimate 1-carboxyvinyltransferase
MVKPIYFSNKIKKFNKKIFVDGDKSLSIRWTLMASMAVGKSRAYNLLKSEDVLSAITSLKKLGVKIRYNKKYHEINGNGLNSYIYKKI